MKNFGPSPADGTLAAIFPLSPPPLIPLGAQGIYPVDVNLHVQPPGRFLAHVGFPPHPAPIGVDILDLGIEDVHLVEELQVHDVEDVGVRHPGYGVQLFAELDLVGARSEEHTSELQSLMRISTAVCCLNKK